MSFPFVTYYSGNGGPKFRKKIRFLLEIRINWLWLEHARFQVVVTQPNGISSMLARYLREVAQKVKHGWSKNEASRT